MSSPVVVGNDGAISLGQICGIYVMFFVDSSRRDHIPFLYSSSEHFQTGVVRAREYASVRWIGSSGI